MKSLPKRHEAIYIDMQDVPFIDVTGANVLKEFITEIKRRHIEVIIGGLNQRAEHVLDKMDLSHEIHNCFRHDVHFSH